MNLKKKSLTFFFFLMAVFLSQHVSLNLLIRFATPAATGESEQLINVLIIANRIVITAVTLFFLSIFVYSRRRIIGPLHKLEESARLYRTESARFPLPKIYNDEIGSLSLSVDKMILTIENQKDKLIQDEKLTALGMLSAGMAHEINNPIAYLQSNYRALEKNLYAFKDGLSLIPAEDFARLKIARRMDEIAEMLEDNKGGLLRIREIVENMKSFSRDEKEAPFKEEALNDLIGETLALTGYSREKEMEVILSLEDTPPVLAQRGRVKQVLLNLILNSQSTLPEDRGVIRIRTWADGINVFSQIEDNGPGVPEEIRGKIFDPFFTTREPGEGTGLGLNISYNIMRQHGGNIELRDSELGGAGFLLSFPVYNRE